MAEVNYGLDAELKRKQEAKYDPELEAQVVAWIETISGESKGDASVEDWLKNGQVLCKLVNAIKPGAVKKVNTSAMPFKQMENITFFMNAARDIGVPESSMFGTPDLYEGKNMGSVISCINALGGVVQVVFPDFDGPKLGVPATHVSKDTKRTGVCASQTGGLAGALEHQKLNTGFRDAAPRAAGGGGSRNVSPRPASPQPGGGAPAAAEGPPEGATSGLDRDLKAKQEAKFDGDLEKEVVGWIEAIVGETKDDKTTAEWLHDGRVLCELANKIKPGSVKKINTSAMPFKQMENITFFMNVARELGVPEMSMFGTPDLYEEKNMGSVIQAIYTLGGAIQVSCPEFDGPKLGVTLTHEAKDRKREGLQCTDQSEAMQRAMQVEKPKDQGIIRGAA